MITDIQDKYNNPDKRIKYARKYSDKLNLHVNGVGLSAALEKINNYENDAQKLARDKFAISNKFITDRLLRPTDNVFSAKGGFVNYIFKTGQETQEKDFKSKLKDVYSGYSLSQYIHRIWFDKFIVDPNGLIFMEVGEDGSDIYPTYKSIHSIRNYTQDGIKVPWVIFEPDVTVFDEERKKIKVAEWFWAVDEANYYRCLKNKDGVSIDETRPHNFGHVPAVICSDIEDHVTGWKKSAIDQQVELLDKFMTDNSVLNIVGFMHSYPQMWRYTDECNVCRGTGVNINQDKESGIRGGELGSIDTSCHSCKGTGKQVRKDVTDITELKPPGESEQKIDPPMGYAHLPIDAWKVEVEVVDRTWNQIMFSQWGAMMEYGSQDGNQYATATGRWTDTQPVNNKLNRYTESAQLIENAVSDIYGKFYYPETFIASKKVYGRSYLVETPDQLLKTYSDSANLGQNAIILDIVFDKYLETEFKDNELLYEYNKKIASLDPFPHYKISDLVSLGLSEQIQKKVFIVEYKNNRTIDIILKMTQEELNSDYEKYISDKNLKTVVQVVAPVNPIVQPTDQPNINTNTIKK